MTKPYNSPVIIKRCAGPEDQAEGKASCEALEAAKVPGPSVRFTPCAGHVEADTPSVAEVESRLGAANLNREGRTERYIEIEPAVAALPPRRSRP